MLPADPASRAGSTPEASGDSSSGTFGKDIEPLRSKSPAMIMRIINSLFILCIITCPLRAEDELTASQVARHLGIYHYRISQDKLPSFYTLSLRRIHDGQLVGPELLGGGFKNNGDLVICARKTEKGIQLSADDDTMIMAATMTETPANPVFLDRCRFSELGIPFLIIAAQEVSENGFLGHFTFPKDYTTAKDGFALTIIKDEN